MALEETLRILEDARSDIKTEWPQVDLVEGLEKPQHLPKDVREAHVAYLLAVSQGASRKVLEELGGAFTKLRDALPKPAVADAPQQPTPIIENPKKAEIVSGPPKFALPKMKRKAKVTQ